MKHEEETTKKRKLVRPLLRQLQDLKVLFPQNLMAPFAFTPGAAFDS